MKTKLSLIFRIAILSVTIVVVLASYSNALAVPPTIDDIPDQTTAEDTPAGPIGFTVGDDVTPVGDLIVTGSSSNLTLVPNVNIVFGGSGANRTVTITPANNQTGNTTITITVDDGSETVQDTFNLEVTAVNDAPVVGDIPGQTIAEGTSFATINLDDYVSDVDNTDAQMVWTYSGNTDLTVSITNRVATISTPNLDWNGNETITFTATDPGLLSDSDGATFTVTPVNDAPVVGDIPGQTIAEGASFVTINLDNHVSDVDNTDAQMVWTYSGNTDLTVSITNRVATISTPNADWNGSETITFTATDPGLLSDSDGATFTVTPVNDTPVVGDIPDQTIAEGTSFATINLDDYVSDVDNTDAQMIWSYSGNTQLTVSITNRVATITTPSTDWNGNETITFTATDPGPSSDSDGATFTVTPVNDPPTLAVVPKTGPEDTDITFATANFTDAFTDVDGDELVQVQVRSLPANGTLKLGTTPVNVNDVIPAAGLGNLIFTPNLNFEGNTSFEWNGFDGQEYALANALVDIIIDSFNDAPTISDIPNQTTNEDTPKGPIAFTVNDIETPPGSLILTKDSSNTALVPLQNIVFGGSGSNRTVTITPTVNLSGSTLITINVSDGAIITPDTFTLTVNPVNDVPSFVEGADQTVNEDVGPVTVANWATNISPGPANEAGQTLTFLVTNNNSALFSVQPTVSATGTLSFTPAADKNGSATVNVVLQDNGGTAFGGDNTSDAQSFTITVNPVNDAPLALDDTYTVMVGDSLSEPALGVLENDRDFDDDPLSAQLVSNPGSGSLTLNTDGSFNYIPAVGFTGVVSFTYQAFDGTATSNIASAQIEVYDGTQPLVEFTGPVNSGETYDVVNQNICLRVDVADDIGIDYVRFYWWDKVKNDYFDLGLDEDPPFELCIGTINLHLGFNQIFAQAYDGSGNESVRKWIWIYKVGDLWAIHVPLANK